MSDDPVYRVASASRRRRASRPSSRCEASVPCEPDGDLWQQRHSQRRSAGHNQAPDSARAAVDAVETCRPLCRLHRLVQGQGRGQARLPHIVATSAVRPPHRCQQRRLDESDEDDEEAHVVRRTAAGAATATRCLSAPARWERS